MSLPPDVSISCDDRRASCPATVAASLSSSEGPDFESSRRSKRSSLASQITFANLFGDPDDEDDFEDISTEPENDSVCSEHVLGYFSASEGRIFLPVPTMCNILLRKLVRSFLHREIRLHSSKENREDEDSPAWKTSCFYT
jgi:hypothetical protein